VCVILAHITVILCCSHQGDIYGVFLPPSLTQGVEQLMARCGATLVNVSLTAYRLMLALYAGQLDVVIGVPQSTREPGTEDLIGYFLNMIPIRYQLPGVWE
jgi:non-ribosomal peptide synthetase component F